MRAMAGERWRTHGPYVEQHPGDIAWGANSSVGAELVSALLVDGAYALRDDDVWHLGGRDGAMPELVGAAADHGASVYALDAEEAKVAALEPVGTDRAQEAGVRRQGVRRGAPPAARRGRAARRRVRRQRPRQPGPETALRVGRLRRRRPACEVSAADTAECGPMSFVVATDDGLYYVDDEGASRQLVDGGFRHVVAADDGAVALAADGTLWNVDDDGAAEFETLPPTRGAITCVLVNGDDVWAGTAGANLWLVRGGDLTPVKAFDDVEGRDTWHTPWGGPPDVRSLDVDEDDALFASVHVGGIVRSFDAGVTWLPSGEIEWDVHQVVTVPDYAATVLAATAQGMALSTDAGETWEVESRGLPHTYCRAIAVTGDHVVLSVSAGPDGAEAALYRRALEDSVFDRVRLGLPEYFAGNVDTYCLSAWDEQVVCAAPGGSVYVSNDNGVRWHELISGLPEPRAIAIL